MTLATLADLLRLPGYRPDLQGPRTRGSTTARGLETLHPTTPLVEFRPAVGDVPEARYFFFEAAHLEGRLGAAPLGRLLSRDLELLRVRHGSHGLELFLDVDPNDADLQPAPEGVAIVGPLGPTVPLGWWTWYVAAGEPSRVMGTIMAGGYATNHPVSSLAVKLHRGVA